MLPDDLMGHNLVEPRSTVTIIAQNAVCTCGCRMTDHSDDDKICSYEGYCNCSGFTLKRDVQNVLEFCRDCLWAFWQRAKASW